MRELSAAALPAPPRPSCPCCAAPAAAAPPAGRRAFLPLAARLAFAALLCAAAFFARARGGLPAALPAGLFAAAWLCAGYDVLLRSARNIRRGRLFDENFLMSAAGAGALAIGEYPEAVAIMVFYQIGEALQESALARSRRSIRALLDIRPPLASLRDGGAIRAVPPSAVRAGDLVVVACGERVPLDGVVESGESTLDRSALTGESLPAFVRPGGAVLAGEINLTGVLDVRVSRPESESAVARMLALVEHARDKKARVENFITAFARYYTPAVVFSALALALLPPAVLAFQAAGAPALPGAELFRPWVYRALVFLVVSCPCALVISVPLGFFAGISCASRHGILVKGGGFMETLAKTGVVVFDKTGTLTKNALSVSRVVPAPGFSEAEILDYAARAEALSSHPAARAIRERAGLDPAGAEAQEARESAGRGASALVRGRRVAAGSRRFLEAEGVPPGFAPDAAADGESAVYAALDGAYAGRFVLSSEIKPEARAAIGELRALGARTIAALSGDSPESAARVGRELALDRALGGLLPEDKLAALEALDAAKPKGAALVYAGDGVNDAPVLARADAGVAMGALGSDAAIEAADVVLMGDDLRGIPLAVRISRKTRRVVRENIVFALGVKAVILACGALGAASIWAAVFGDVGVALLAVINSMRALKAPTAP